MVYRTFLRAHRRARSPSFSIVTALIWYVEGELQHCCSVLYRVTPSRSVATTLPKILDRASERHQSPSSVLKRLLYGSFEMPFRYGCRDNTGLAKVFSLGLVNGRLAGLASGQLELQRHKLQCVTSEYSGYLRIRIRWVDIPRLKQSPA